MYLFAIYMLNFSILNKKLNIKPIILLIVLCLSFKIAAQSRFIIDKNKTSFNLSFELVNDLVIIPVQINGVELSFLLDTGVDATILFSLGDQDTLNLNNPEVIFLRGLGEGEPVQGLKSYGNEVVIGGATNNNLSLYLVFDNPLGLSNRMGVPVHGIIGFDLFRDFIIEFDYLRQRLKAFEPNAYKIPRCKNCDELKLVFHRNKPYVDIKGKINNTSMPLSLLVDSGSGDALWLFENETGITVPENNFKDFLGFGIGGSVYGSRSRIDGIDFGRFSFPQITASFPDSIYHKGIETYEGRNGSVGAQVLKRFHLTIDYPGKKLRFKPNRNLNDPFEYDMSGVVVAHDGFTVIQDILRNPIALRDEDKNNTASGYLIYKSTYDIKYSLEPQYKIVEIRENSPAAQGGLKAGDILIKINSRPAYKFTLTEIASLLSSGEGKRIRLLIERNGIEKLISFNLERII
ncbi:hypothetical protein BH23BAC2_BH23BAC2_08860 [soil metagenome]